MQTPPIVSPDEWEAARLREQLSIVVDEAT